MAKRDRTREALDALTEVVRADPRSPEAGAALTEALAARSNLVVARAITSITDAELPGFGARIEAAFHRAMRDPLRRDPGCRTKTAAVRALDALREPADALFLAGVRHVQPEPVWGGTQDSAVALRGLSAMALVHRRHPEALSELARLLADPEREARRMAADAIAVHGDPVSGVPLLTLRICIGDPEPEVSVACLAALLDLDPEQGLSFAREQLRADDPTRAESAALALAQSRPEGAFAALREFAEGCLGDQRQVAFLALSMLRSEAAWALLLEVITEAEVGPALAAIEALAIYREHGQLATRVQEALAGRQGDSSRESASLDDALGEHFG